MDSVFKIAAAIRDYLGIPPNLTFWEMANSELIIAVATLIIGVVINRRVGRIGEKVDDSRLEDEYTAELDARPPLILDSPADLSKNFEPDADEVAEPEAPQLDTPAGGRFSIKSKFHDGSNIIGKLKEYVDSTAEDVADGRKRRKYKNIGKRDYRIRVRALEDDNAISHSVANELIAAFEAWRPYMTNAAQVPDEVFERLEQAHKSLNGGQGTLRRHRRRRNV